MSTINLITSTGNMPPITSGSLVIPHYSNLTNSTKEYGWTEFKISDDIPFRDIKVAIGGNTPKLCLVGIPTKSNACASGYITGTTYKANGNVASNNVDVAGDYYSGSNYCFIATAIGWGDYDTTEIGSCKFYNSLGVNSLYDVLPENTPYKYGSTTFNSLLFDNGNTEYTWNGVAPSSDKPIYFNGTQCSAIYFNGSELQGAKFNENTLF